MAQLSTAYDEALVYASSLHREQRRKGTDVPYLSHLLSVSALVLEGGGDEDQAIAALLHDALEDQPDLTSYDDLRERFGVRVADIVRACSDTEVQPKPPWRHRKEGFLRRLAVEPPDVLLVSLADKLHNARAILLDLRTAGAQVWERFNAPREDQLWYYSALVATFESQLPEHPLTQELRRTAEGLSAG